MSINTGSGNKLSIKNRLTLSTAVCVLAIAVVGVSTPVMASDAGAFLGGVLATKVVGNMERRTEAEEAEAAKPVPKHSAPAQKSTEQRIKELDKLKAGGYISEQEYKQKKQAILDSI